jgi:hypothetical protein
VRPQPGPARRRTGARARRDLRAQGPAADPVPPREGHPAPPRRGHRTKAAFERDHTRDLDLEARGYGVGRVSWLQFRTDRPAVLAALRRWLPP